MGNAGDGTVSTTTGYELSAGDQVFIAYVAGLDKIMVDADTDGQSVCWMILAGVGVA